MSRTFFGAAAWLCALAAGCGSSTYEQRLAETNDLFAYQNTLDRHLSATRWMARDDFGVSLRTPQGFAMIPPPPAAPAEGSDETPPPDSRQPSYLGIHELPGLIDAWRGELPTYEGGHAVAFLYALGNQQRFLDRASNLNAGPEPAQFLPDLENMLTEALEVSINDRPSGGALDNVRIDKRIPREEEYAVSRSFTVVSLVPSREALDRLGIPELRIELYEYRARDVQVAFMFVCPASVKGKPVESLELALETLEVSDRPPQRKRSGSAGGGGAKPAGF